MMRWRRWGLWAGLGLSLGCTDRADRVTRDILIVDREALGGEVVYVDQANSEAFAVNVVSGELRPQGQRFELPAHPLDATARIGADELLVRCDGRQNEYGDTEEPPTLAAVTKTHQVRSYGLDASVGELVQSSDGSIALLWGVGTVAGGNQLLSDPNRVSLISLDEPPGNRNPIGKTMPTSGGQVSGALITEPLLINGAERRLGIFESEGGITLWDLSHPARAPITVELRGSWSRVRVQKVVADREAGQLYLLIEGSADIHVLSFLSANDSHDNDFWPSLNQLQLGPTVGTDIVLMKDDDVPKVLAAVGGAVAVVRASENVVTSIPVGVTVQRLLPFEGVSPTNDEVQARVLGWSPGESTVAFVDLYELEQLGTRNVELLSLGHPIKDVIELGQNRLLAVFSDAAIGTIALDSRRFTPLSSSSILDSPVVDHTSGRVWVAPEYETRLGYFATDTLSFGEVRLDAAIEDFFVLGGTSPRVAVTHPHLLGSMTVVDAKNPSRKTAHNIEGFWVDGLAE